MGSDRDTEIWCIIVRLFLLFLSFHSCCIAGLFNCTKGTCVNVTSALTCNKFTSIDKQVSCKRRENCQALDGFYTCADGFCMRVFEPYTCERRCTHMTTRAKNTVIFNGNSTACRFSVHLKINDRL